MFYAVESERTFRVPASGWPTPRRVHAPTFVYLFGWGSPAMRGWLGACHGLEIAFVFGNQGRGELAAFTGAGPEADALAERMMDAWLAFVHTGDPSTPDAAVARARRGDPPHHGVRRHDPSSSTPRATRSGRPSTRS